MKSHEFASLLCSRLCHDLLSPVGALNNGIELLSDEHDPEMRARCIDLLGESARASANKLKFFRLAFGAAGGFADDVDTREARVAIEGLFGGEGRIQLGWMGATYMSRIIQHSNRLRATYSPFVAAFAILGVIAFAGAAMRSVAQERARVIPPPSAVEEPPPRGESPSPASEPPASSPDTNALPPFPMPGLREH